MGSSRISDFNENVCVCAGVRGRARRVYLSRYACVYLCAVNLVPNTGFITLFRPFENAYQNKYRIRILPIGVYRVLSLLYTTANGVRW